MAKSESKLKIKVVYCDACHLGQNDRGQVNCTSCASPLPTTGRVLKPPVNMSRVTGHEGAGIRAL